MKVEIVDRSNRAYDALRPVKLDLGYSKYAEGSCLIEIGLTKVLCNASVALVTPTWLRGTGTGWVTAEYGMLPRATNSRVKREAKSGQSGRTQEIQRLIGRTLRSVIDRSALGTRTITIDCDVLQADGGTRCAAISGGFVALKLAVDKLLAAGDIKTDPIAEHVAAISCGVIGDKVALDLDYGEDFTAAADANFAITESGKLTEIQASGEGTSFTRSQFDKMLAFAGQGCISLIEIQKRALAEV